MNDLIRLREIANAATPGPWEYEAGGESECGEPSCCSDYWDERVWGGGFVLLESHLLDPENAQHIAAFDPPTVLALLDEIEELRRWKAEMVQMLDGLNKLAQAAEVPPGGRITETAPKRIEELRAALVELTGQAKENDQ